MKTWTDLCAKRKLHCDFCLGVKGWYEAMKLRFIMPPFGTCPFGETIEAGKLRRLDRLEDKVRRGLMTAFQAERVSAELKLPRE